MADYYDIEEELVKWYTKNLLENADKVRRAIQNKAVTLAAALYDILSGIKVTYPQIKEALSKTRLEGVPFEDWEEEEFRAFATEIRYLSKPTLIVANKMDMPVAEKNLAGLVETFGRSFVIPVSAEVELLLRRAEKAGAISYTPGDEKFVVKDASKLTPKQKWALEYVQSRIFDKWLRTGVDLAVTTAVLKLLRVNVVYPVEDAKKYSDRKGNVLPDAYLMPQGSTPKDLARQIHSELYDNFLYAIDSVSGIRLPNNYELRDRDVITIVTTRKRKT